MQAQIFLVTSVRGNVFAPQMVANAGERALGAKIPTPFFFIAKAFFFADADFAFLPAVLLMAVNFFRVAFVVLTFGVVVFFVVVFVISIKRWKCTKALSLEPKWQRGLLRRRLRHIDQKMEMHESLEP